MRLRGKVAFVTAAASGIGKEVASTLAFAGARVVVADPDRRRAEATAAALHGCGRRVIGLPVDVTDERQVEAGIAAAVEIFGRLDILVSNAAMDLALPLESTDLVQWRDVLAVHLDGAFLTTRAALPYMYEQGEGAIIYIGSVHADGAPAASASHVLAEHGLMGLARFVDREGRKRGVRATAICPGVVRPSAAQQQIPDEAAPAFRDLALNDAAAQEAVSAAEVAAAVLRFAAAEPRALAS